MIIIYLICANRKEAIKIANYLIDKRLAACVNFFPVDSIYRWRGKKEKAKEFVLLIKTTKINYQKIERAVLKLHSYKIPCLISWPITKGYSKYLDWVKKEVK